jgi:aldehyde:ferredoxin oxidoreductase
MRLFNQREGFGARDDVLPKRTYEQEFSDGAAKGEHVEEDEFYKMRSLYYDMAGLDEDGHPRHSKIVELDLKWAEELLHKAE